MTWTPGAKANEARKIVWELAPYTRGRVLDIGSGHFKALPHFIGVDNGAEWGPRGVDVKADAHDLSLFSDGSCDAVFSSHLLEHIHYEDVSAVLKEWMRVVKMGGYLILYLPDEDQYPKVGEPGSNTDHKWNVNKERVLEAMGGLAGWDLVDYQIRSEEDEYSLFFVFRKTEKGQSQSYLSPKPEKTAAVVRYGAQGDMIQMSSVLPWLKENGYHVTLYCQAGLGYEVIKHDPHIDRFIVQNKDDVPNQFLAEFWDYTKKKYTKWINLCETVEGTLLASPGRIAWYWPNDLRAKMMDVNYLEFIHQIAEVPPPYRPKFYATPKELEKASWQARQWGRKNILWSLSGSSGHKTWPHVDAIIARLMLTYKDVHVVLVGDESCQILERGWEKEKRVHRRSGVWGIRESMAFAEVADLIIGTETGLLNAVGSVDVPKIICLSHSSEEMLTKHWKKVIPLRQPEGVGCNKQPCRQLHGSANTSSWLDCPQHEETGAAMCQFHISPDVLWAKVQGVISGN